MTSVIAALAASLITGSVALSQTTSEPCKFRHPLLRTETGAPLTYTSSEMKARAQRKADLSGLTRNADIKGTAKVDLLIGTSGEVVCMKVAPTHPLIRVSVERALSSWIFKPEQKRGKPIAYGGWNSFCAISTAAGTLLA
jgi:hypothetical protein